MTKHQNFSVTLETRDLSKVLSLASSIVEKRNVLPILSHIKLETESNKLILTATDMDIALQLELGAEVKNKGAITVHSETFANIIRKITDKTLEMEYIDSTSQVAIHTKNYEVELSTLPVHEFPVMDNFTTKLEFTVPASAMITMLEMTKFAISTEETRYNLNGVYLHSVLSENSRYLASAATDGHRLAAFRSDVTVLEDFGIILPRKTVAELYKILKDSSMSEQVVSVAVGHNRVKFTAAGMTIISKLIDGTFPDYQIFIPVSNENKLVISAQLLREVVDRVATVTAEKFPAIKMTIMEDQLELYAHGEARGLANEVIPLKEKGLNYTGNQVTIGLNPRYILDVLSALGNDEVFVMLADGFAPALIKSTTYPNGNFVVMPVKV